MIADTDEHDLNAGAVDAPEVPEHFCVHDDESANWVIRKVVECRAYAKRCAEWAEREQARAKHEEIFFLFRYREQLITYARGKIAEQGGRRKSVTLPAGVIGFRKDPPKIVVDDEAAVIAWAREHHPDLIRVVEHLSKSGLNDHVKQTGELPDVGAHIEGEREDFYMR